MIMIVLYRGSRGKGKTLTMVKDAYKYHLAGFKVLGNLNLTFGSYISSSDVVNLNHRSDLRDCVLVIDEIELFFDSRNFSKQENKTFSHFLQQVRKRNIIILCTAQYTGLVDLRIRQQLDVVVYPKFDPITHFCSCLYFNLTEMEDNFSSDLHFSPSYICYDATKIFALYDTYEILL
jgi:hypothetical protein